MKYFGVDDVGLAPEQVIHHAIDRLLIAGNDARGQHHRVALLDFGVLVIVDRGSRQGGHRLALGSADQYAYFLGGIVFHLAGMNQQPFGNLDIAQIFGDLGGTVHGTPDKCYFSAVLPGQFDGELEAMNRRRKAGDEQPAFGAGENLVKLAPHRPLARGVSLALDVGRVLEQSEHAFFAVFGKGVEIEQPVVGRGGIDLEIPGVNDDAERGLYRQSHAIDQAVRDLDGVDGEGPDLEALPGDNFMEAGGVEQPVLLELVLHIGEGKLRAPDGNVQFGQDPGQRSDVILVPVGENDAAHPVPVLGQVADVGNNDVHAEEFGLREHQSGVDDDDVLAPAHGHAVHPELAQAAQGYDLQFSSRH